MFATTKSFALAATLSIAALSTAATAEEMTKVSQINVTASYEAAEDTNAQALYPEITKDIQLAIAELVPVSDNGADPVVMVDIRKVALNGDTILPESAEFNQLEGVVSIEVSSGPGGQSFPVNVTAVMADAGAVPEGYVVIAPSLDDFYRAMVEGFAVTVAEQISTLNTVGGKTDQ